MPSSPIEDLPQEEYDLPEKYKNVKFPKIVNTDEYPLIIKQCELQGDDTPEDVQRFALSYGVAKERSFEQDFFETLDAEKLTELIIELGVITDSSNENGFRTTPVSFKSGEKGAPYEQIPHLINSWCEAFVSKSFESPEEAFKAFEEIHPFEDGNGRVGDLLWKMYTKMTTNVWPKELPPDVFNMESEIAITSLTEVSDPQSMKKYLEHVLTLYPEKKENEVYRVKELVDTLNTNNGPDEVKKFMENDWYDKLGSSVFARDLILISYARAYYTVADLVENDSGFTKYKGSLGYHKIDINGEAVVLGDVAFNDDRVAYVEAKFFSTNPSKS